MSRVRITNALVVVLALVIVTGGVIYGPRGALDLFFGLTGSSNFRNDASKVLSDLRSLTVAIEQYVLNA